MNPKFILSKKRLLEQYKLTSSISDQISYSFKTNPFIGTLLEKETNCFFSIHTEGSLKKLQDPSRAWFFLQAQSESQMLKLHKYGVKNFVVDNEKDLQSLTNTINNRSLEINLLLRMKLKENTIQTGRHFVYGMSSTKIISLLPTLRANKNIQKLGIHFHRKTQNVAEWDLREELEELFPENVLNQLDLMNIGGGIPYFYKNFKLPFLDNIIKKIADLKSWLNQTYNISMLVEPGRFLAAPAVKLETEILLIYNNNIIINCSIFNASMDTFIEHLRLLIDGECEEGNKGAKPFLIKGCTPDSPDIFRYKVFLKNPKVGDKLIFLNAGAYNFHSDFCGLERVPYEVVE